MNRRALIMVVLVVGVILALMVYRRHHAARTLKTFTTANDPFRSGPTVPAHPSAMDQNMATIREVNRINRLNQQQAQKKPSDRKN